MGRRGILEKYASLLDLPVHAVKLNLGEGDTPLISLPRIAKSLGNGVSLFAKYEGLNPTGSFKDRGMVAAVSEALGAGAKTIICASTGNTAASAAAYGSRAGLRTIVLVPEGKVARGKIAASVMYGAQVVQIEGSFDQALQLVREISAAMGIAVVNSINPYRLEGQKTAAFEVCDALGKAPYFLFIPVGNAGNISSYYMGFTQYNALKQSGMPKLFGVQAEGAAPLVIGAPVENPETIATAIRIGKPARGGEALAAAKNSGGKILAVSDNEILAAQKLLAQEGVWVEPASAASLAGLIKEVKSGLDISGKTIVLVCTGNGLKDPDIVEIPEFDKIPPDIEALRTLLA